MKNEIKNEMEKRQLRLEIANFEIINTYKKERMEAKLAKIDEESEKMLAEEAVVVEEPKKAAVSRNNVVKTRTVKRVYNTYNVEITSREDSLCGTLFQTHIDGKSHINQSDSIEGALTLANSMIWDHEMIAQMKANNPERFAS